MPLILTASDEAATTRIAAALAQIALTGDCILLRGDLGAGKTAFARGFIRALGYAQDDIVSPTFTLVQHYALPGEKTIWHFDLYRLTSAQEVVETGLEEALHSGISLIEWPEIAAGFLPDDALDIHMAHGSQPDERIMTLRGKGWENRLSIVKESTHT